MADMDKRGCRLRRAIWRVLGPRRAPRRRGRQHRAHPMPFRSRARPVPPPDRGGAPIRKRAAPRRSGAAVLHGGEARAGRRALPATKDRRSGPPLPRNAPADRGAACWPPAPREPIRSPDESRPFWRPSRSGSAFSTSEVRARDPVLPLPRAASAGFARAVFAVGARGTPRTPVSAPAVRRAGPPARPRNEFGIALPAPPPRAPSSGRGSAREAISGLRTDLPKHSLSHNHA